MDIANSGKVQGAVALQALEIPLADAVRSAPFELPADEAWNYLSALARKLHGRAMPHGIEAVDSAISELVGRAPEGAVALLSQPDDLGVVNRLIQIIADSIGNNFTDRAERALLSAPAPVLGTLVAESKLLAARVAGDAPLVDYIGQILPQLEITLAASVGRKLLPSLTMDWQLPAARPILHLLNAEELAAEVHYLGTVNDFAAAGIADLCLKYARELGAKRFILPALSSLPRSQRRDDILLRALDPSVEDAQWLLRVSGLPVDVTAVMFARLLCLADDGQLETVLADRSICAEAIDISGRVAPDLLRRFIFIDAIPLDAFVRIASFVFVKSTAGERIRLAIRALERCLGHPFDGDDIGFVTAMLDAVGEQLDVSWAIRLGLSRGVRASVASRNMAAFHSTSDPARSRVVHSIEDITQLICDRGSFDLDAVAAQACAALLLEANAAVPRFALSAAGHLLPMLMRQRSEPVSPLIAAAFPMIYRELAKKEDVPDLLKFVPFFDWDRCKAARHELVSAFMASTWAPGDLAIIACRCSDIARIMRRAAKARGGEAYLSRIVSDLTGVPDECRGPVEEVIASIHSKGS